MNSEQNFMPVPSIKSLSDPPVAFALPYNAGGLQSITAAAGDWKTTIGKRGQGALGIAQINVAPGDLSGNAQRILDSIHCGTALGLDLVIFPELALMGYSPRDIMTRYPFLIAENVKWLNALAAETGETYALVGFVEPRELTAGGSGKPFYNAVALLGQGKVLQVIRKTLLPQYGEFEDPRQFQPAAPKADAKANIVTVHGVRYGVTICEDAWSDPDFFETPMYDYDPMASVVAQKPDVLINICASPSRARKEAVRHQLCTHIARKAGLPLVYVNQVGTVDEVSFDGASRAYRADGTVLAFGPAFAEQFLVVSPQQNFGPRFDPIISPLSAVDPTLRRKRFEVGDPSDLARTHANLVQGIQDYFRKTGFQRAVIGLSGGLDSSVTAVLLADALGGSNVLAVGMPSAITPHDNRDDGEIIARNLGLHWAEIPIGTVTQTFQTALAPVLHPIADKWGKSDIHSNAADNIQAISRATILRQLGNEFRAFPVATSDKSEFYLGYATVNGDMSGALAPLGDIPKSKVRALAHWLNAHRSAALHTGKDRGEPVIPVRVIEKPSGADLKIDPLTGRTVTAEDELMPYEFADEVIWRIETLHEGFETLLAAPFEYEQKHSLTPTQKQEWLTVFFQRMSRAVFKWFVAPPILINEGNGSIAKTDYRHPITANKIHWPGHTPETIQSLLKKTSPAEV